MNLNGIGRIYKKQKRSTFIEVPRARFISAIEKLKERDFTRISSITGYDSGRDFEVIYHFDFRGQLVNLKVRLPHQSPCIDTISRHFPGALLFERELMEMLGIKVEGHPDPRKLFLCKDSPSCPLRKVNTYKEAGRGAKKSSEAVKTSQKTSQNIKQKRLKQKK